LLRNNLNAFADSAAPACAVYRPALFLLSTYCLFHFWQYYSHSSTAPTASFSLTATATGISTTSDAAISSAAASIAALPSAAALYSLSAPSAAALYSFNLHCNHCCCFYSLSAAAAIGPAFVP
jgi:hypothetical protein